MVQHGAGEYRLLSARGRADLDRIADLARAGLTQRREKGLSLAVTGSLADVSVHWGIFGVF